MKYLTKHLLGLCFIFTVMLNLIVVIHLTYFNNAKFISGCAEEKIKQRGETLNFNIVESIGAIRIKQLMTEHKIQLPDDHSADLRTGISRVVAQNKKILIVTTWRSGSTFLGEIISSAPGVFYSYEPLYYLERSNSSKMELIRSLLQCKFPIEYLRDINGLTKGSQNFMKMNRRVWDACQHNANNLCVQPEFVGQLCSLFPVHLMKVVRLRMKELSSLLTDDSLTKEWKIIYLVRDPRGVVASRKNLAWCDPDPACNNEFRLCTEVKDDLERINKLKNRHPDRFYLLKFEDLASSVEIETEKLYNFLGMAVTDSVKLFLSQHTKSNKTISNPFSTIRQSNTVAVGWKSKLSEEDIANITTVCEPTLNILDPLHNKSSV